MNKFPLFLPFQERWVRNDISWPTTYPGWKVSGECWQNKILIFSSTAIWSKIIDSQFRMLGFTDSFVVAEFELLIRQIIENLQGGMQGKFGENYLV